MSQQGPAFDVISQLGALRRYAWSLTRDRSQAEDLVHDALVRAYAGRRTFRPGSDLRRWLLSILHNTFLNELRRRRAEGARLERMAEVADDRAAPEQETMVRIAQIRAAFFDLPDEQRAALHLVAIEGLSYQEAAETLGIPIGTLMSRLGRGREALRALEQGRGAPEPGAARPRCGRRFRVVGDAHDPAD